MNIQDAANIACGSLLPAKSKVRYNICFESFMNWCASKDIEEISENVLLAYFLEKANVLKSPTSLWSEYSMLKLTISIYKNLDISKFQRLKAFLKRKNDGYQPKKSQVFTSEEITKFLQEAQNDTYLMKKVVTIFGVAGACRSDELYNLRVQDVQHKNSVIMVHISSTKNNVPRKFVVTNGEDENNWITIVQRYMELRPKNAEDKRFFYRYERGRCVNQVVGKHTISKIPFEIAKFLNLPNPTQYTGHSFRRTSSTLLANAPGVDILDLKRHGGWKSTNVAEGYIADSLCNKIQTANKILHANSINIERNVNNIKETEIDGTVHVQQIENTTILTETPLDNIKENVPVQLNGTYTNCKFVFNIK
jgi:integrase